ncbi:nucleotide pyrophosphohydrolase [Membranihabitans maritimus]|uniref:nucleotide pyrophosphohydrolase n=1 Tax=Membranihabitans maritimus TaxID=2904244 RepID=UPI001F48BCE4|nr:nucleotide pyrophosphohydrolase [Membranihabitans maritimus]
MELTCNDYQSKVDDWIQSFGVRYFEEKTNMLILMEEVGELSRLMSRVYGEQSFKEDPGNHKKLIEDELADVFFVLTCLCNQMDINIQEVLIKNLNKKSTRDSKRHHKNPKLR